MVKGADMAKRDKENTGHPPPQAQCQTAKTKPAHYGIILIPRADIEMYNAHSECPRMLV